MELPELTERGVRNIFELSIPSSMMELLGILAGERPYHSIKDIKYDVIRQPLYEGHYQRRLRSAACWRLFSGGGFAEFAQALLQLAPQHRGRIGIEGHQIPERLAA